MVRPTQSCGKMLTILLWVLAAGRESNQAINALPGVHVLVDTKLLVLLVLIQSCLLFFLAQFAAHEPQQMALGN